jgi:hypothetical protein
MRFYNPDERAWVGNIAVWNDGGDLFVGRGGGWPFEGMFKWSYGATYTLPAIEAV